MTAPRVFSRPVVATLVVLLAVQVIMLALQVWDHGAGPRDVPVGVTGPVLVAQALAGRAAGRLDATVVTDLGAGRAAVRDGDLVAVVSIDVGAAQDQLLVSSVAGPELNRYVTAQVRPVSASYGRSLVVTEVPPTRDAGTPRALPFVLVLLWMLLGVVAAAVLTIVRGPVAASWGAGAGRLAALAGVGAVLGLGIALACSLWLAGGLVLLWVTGSVTVLVAAWVTLSLESLVGLLGIGVAATFLVGLATPLATLTDPLLLPVPWSWVESWTPHLASLTLARQAVHFGGAPSFRAVALLAVWATVPALALVVARRVRPSPGPAS